MLTIGGILTRCVWGKVDFVKQQVSHIITHFEDKTKKNMFLVHEKSNLSGFQLKV